MSNEFEELRLVLSFLRDNFQNAYFSEEITNEINLPIERVRSTVDNAMLNQWLDVDHFSDDGNPCVQINPHGNRRLNQLTGRNEPFPTPNVTQTTIIGDGNVVGDNNTINPDTPSSPTFEKWNLVVAIIVGVFVIASVVLGFSVHFNSLENDSSNLEPIAGQTEVIKNEMIENALTNNLDDSSVIPYLDVWKTFKENRPYTLSWTDCGFGTAHEQEGTVWNFSMKPIMLNKNNEPALISFNISYRFHFEGLIDDKWKQLPQAIPETTQKLTLDPKANPWIHFSGMTQAIEESYEQGITKIQIIKSKSSFIPYSESIDDNLLDSYEPDREDYVVTQFDYNLNSNNWHHNPPKNSICADLYDR